MCKRLIFSFLLFLFLRVSFAQDVSSFIVVEETSTDLYIAKNWEALANYGNKAIGNGYDYFYLRLRLGIAYYEQKKYMKAVKHFEKAVKFNSSDKLALEYLYYSYIFSARESEARALISMFPIRLKYLIKPQKNKFFECFSFEGGLATSNQNRIFKNIDINGPLNKYGEASINNGMSYWQAGFAHQLGNKFSVFHSYSDIKINFIRKINANNKDTLDNYKLNQHDYYISCVNQFKHFSISPALHLISLNFGKLNANYNLSDNKYIFNKKDTSFINFASSVSVIKNIGKYCHNLSFGFSQLNGFVQFQTAFATCFYPFGKTNLYATSSIIHLNEDYTNRIIIMQKIGFKIMPKLWAEFALTYGNMKNYCENNAFVVFNTEDKILSKYGFSINAPLFKHLEFSLRYTYFNRENSYYRASNFDLEEVKINYKTQILLGGIKWKL